MSKTTCSCSACGYMASSKYFTKVKITNKNFGYKGKIYLCEACCDNPEILYEILFEKYKTSYKDYLNMLAVHQKMWDCSAGS